MNFADQRFLPYRPYYWFIGFLLVTLVLSPFLYSFAILKNVPSTYIIFLVAPYIVMILILTGWKLGDYNLHHCESAIQNNLDGQNKYHGHIIQYRISTFTKGEHLDLFMIFAIYSMILTVRRQYFDLILSTNFTSAKKVPLRLKLLYFFTRGVVLNNEKAVILVNMFWKINADIVKRTLNRLTETVNRIEYLESIDEIKK